MILSLIPGTVFAGGDRGYPGELVGYVTLQHGAILAQIDRCGIGELPQPVDLEPERCARTDGNVVRQNRQQAELEAEQER